MSVLRVHAWVGLCCHVCVLTVCGHHRPGCVVVKIEFSAKGAIVSDEGRIQALVGFEIIAFLAFSP